MATYGSVGEFDETQEPWELYIDRLEEFFVANKIESDDQKRAILNAQVGAKAYQLINKLLSPKKPKEATFTEICTVMQNHCVPTTSVIVERCKFSDRVRRPGESISDYVAAIRGIAQKCDFGEELNTNLRDRLVTGIQDLHIKRTLIAQGDKLDFKKALETAQSMEQADKHARDLGGSSKPVHQVNKFKQTSRNSKPKTDSRPKGAGASTKACYRCGRQDHLANKCWAKNLTCHKCERKGHVAAACRSGKRRDGQSQSHVNQVVEQDQCTCSCTCKEQSSVHVAKPEMPSNTNNDNNVTDEYSLYKHDTNRADSPFYVELMINGKQITMELDTGAGKTIISEATYNQWGPDRPPLQPPDCKLNTYTHESIPLLGSCKVNVEYNEQCELLPLIIGKGEGANLLGRDWLKHIRLDWSQIFSVHNIH